MAIDAARIKELREKTGMGISQCKKALEETGGDLDKAELLLRKQGIDKAAKKADRPTGQGVIAIRREGSRAAMIELACEQEPTAGNERFLGLARLALDLCLEGKLPDSEALSRAATPEGGFGESLKALIGVVGENIQLKKAVYLEAPPGGLLGSYLHFNKKAGALVALALAGGDPANPGLAAVANDLAMHAVAARPLAASRESLPPAALAREREVFGEEVKKMPEAIREKVLDGKLQKFYTEKVFPEQIFVKDPDRKATVRQVLDQAAKAAEGKAEIAGFARFELGL
ncbi:MAG: translation elongation factor Ts [Planctomycetota bacterium]|jgi:elongation factor Ts|nr:translation elongation factor Ts [Planctomycetota bacterium]